MGKLNRFFNNEQKKKMKRNKGDDNDSSVDDESTKDLNQDVNKLNTVFLGNEKNALKNKKEVKEDSHDGLASPISKKSAI